ncbi:hypothetical protein BGX38DRAFT_1161535, partial [Terfezia claveryi]
LASMMRSSFRWRISSICSAAPGRCTIRAETHRSDDFGQSPPGWYRAGTNNVRTCAVLAQHTHIPGQARVKFPAPPSPDQGRLGTCMVISEERDI